MNSPRGQRVRDLRRAAESGDRANNGASEPARPAVEVERDARAASERLKDILMQQPPWSREVEVHRQKSRNLFLTLLFGHPLSTHSQSLEPLWHHTTYSLISSYRSIVAKIEANLPPLYSGKKFKPTPAHSELKKVLSRFRQLLLSEDTFYRDLVTRLVTFYQLQSLSKEYLSAISIGVPAEIENGGPEHGLSPNLGYEERKEKLGLVYKALICLGDLERYKEQYDEKARRDVRGGKVVPAKFQERYGKSWTYYEVARALVPDDGSAFNQLAVISTYLGDDFLCVYYYIRALAVKNAFKNIQEILEKFLRKSFEKWAGKQQRRRRDEEEEEGEEGEDMKAELVTLIAILYRRQGLSSIGKLQASFLSTLSDRLRQRQLPSEAIVRITVMTIGTHWQARQSASLGPAGEDPQLNNRRHQAETQSLHLLLAVYTEYVVVSLSEVEEALKARNDDSAIDDDDEPHPALHLHISAILRRMLPSLRIFSKWLKLHTEYMARVQRSGQLGTLIKHFWDNYRRLVIALATLFPIDHLPHLSEPLEEDIDMRGFIPLAWGMIKGKRETQHDFHPNEEQLMRIADLQVDAKLLAQTQSGSSALTYQHQALPVPSHSPFPAVPPRERQDDLASVSTETEDDPVNMAMRATLAGSSVSEDEIQEDDNEEVIVWNGNVTSNNHPPPSVTHRSLPHSASPVGPGTPTAQDLLQNLMLGGNPSPAQHTPALPHLPRQNSQPSTAQGSPGMLFGGDANGSSIWTMTRAESGRGSQRGPAPGQGVNLANIWSDQPSPSPHQALGGQPSPGPIGPAGPVGQGWHRASVGSAGLGGSDWGVGVRNDGFGLPPGIGSATGIPGDRKTSTGPQAWNGSIWNGQPAGYPR